MSQDNPFSDFTLDRPEVVIDEELVGEKRIAIIRTSDRIQFRQCRRRWGWQSHMRKGMGPTESASPLWFGTGMHFALEDFHGQNIFKHPRDAFLAYVKATMQFHRRGGPSLPGDSKELTDLGVGMMEHYADSWLLTRDPLRTYVHHGVPQVEVHVLVPIDLGLLPDWVSDYYDEVLYAATFDRVILDDFGQLFIVEYKSAARLEWSHLPTDPQVNAYCWLGSQMYDEPIAGVIYQQHLKRIPELPRILANGRELTSQIGGTTYNLYHKQAKNLYGAEAARWPAKAIQALNALGKEENGDKDAFIQRQKVFRSTEQIQAEGQKVLLELEDMLNPELPLYPNPHRLMCSWCSFQAPCIDMDDGGDWEFVLDTCYKPQPVERDTWRKHLILPQL